MTQRPHIVIFNPDQWRGDVLGHRGNLAGVLDVDRFHFAMVGTHKEWQGISYVDVEKG